MTEPSRAVFLSYASQDAQAALRICETLRAAGIDVWFDQSELRGGDVWDHKIRRQIRDCALFVPVISASTASRREAYFRLEWDLADQRTHMMARSRVFVLPVCLDETSEAAADVPESFQRVQWTRLPAGVVPPAFTDHVRRLLSESSPTNQAPASVAATRPSSRSTRTLLVAIAVVVSGAASYLVVDELRGARRAEVPHSIAVLPFTDMSGKKDQEYFAAGMAEETINLLTKVPQLRVIGRISSLQLAANADDLRRISATLGAAYVVEGSVGRIDNHVRVTARLIDTRDGTYRWSESYDRDVSDVLKVQEEVALAIVRALQLEVTSGVFRGPQSAQPSADAYDEYLRGLRARDRLDQRGFEEALAHFRHALQLEPSFSPAQEASASTLYYMAESAYLPPQSGFNQARAAAEAALKLDPESSVAHAVICIVNTIFDWDWPAAARECAIAARISPNQPFVLQAAALQQMALGQWKDSAASIEAAITNDPLDPALYNIAARIYVRAGRIREAETAVRRALQISPTSAFNHHLLGIALLLQGRANEALAEMQHESSPGAQALGLVLAYHALHRDRDADAALTRLIATNGTDWAFSISEAYAFRAQRDSAFSWLERSFVQRDEDLFAVKGAPLLKNLEADPRYKAFLQRMKLPGS